MKYSCKQTFINLKIASFNCRGLNCDLKRKLIFERFGQSDATIICLQETKLKPDEEFSYINEWDKGQAIFNSVDGGKSGTAVLINSNEVSIGHPIVDQAGRIIAVDIIIDGNVLRLINTYFPNNPNEQYKFIYDLQPYFHSPHPIVWVGDHNISTDSRLDRFPPRDTADRFGSNILEIIDNYDLKDVCRSLYPTRDMFTYSQDQIRSRIDKIIVDKSFVVNKFYHEVSNHSDHMMIIAHLHLNHVVEKGFGVWRNNISLFKNEAFGDEFQILWNFWKLTCRTNCPIKFWVQVKRKVKSFLIDVGKNCAKQKRMERDREVDELKNAHYCNNQNRGDSIKKYVEKKKILAKLEIEQIKEKIEERKCQDFVDRDKPTKCFFQKFQKTLKSRKVEGLCDQDGVVQNSLEKILCIASDFYEGLFQQHDMNENIMNTFINNVNPITNIAHLYDVLCRDFTVEETEDAMLSFKIGRSPGPDGLSIEFYRSVFHIIKYDLVAVFNRMKDSEFVPSQLKNGLIVIFPKGKDANNIENYRGITLNNVDLKIFTKMLHLRLAPVLEDAIHYSQYANKGKKEWELNCVIRDIFNEMKYESDLDSFLVRVDFKKAFDSIDLDYLYKVMEKMGLPSKFIAMVKAVDEDVKAQVLINGAKSRKFNIKRGTRQGDPLSMDKFMIALDPLLRALHNNSMIRKYTSKSNKQFLTLAKADDLTVVTNYLSSLIHVKHVINRFEKASGLEVNLDKTKGFFINKQNCHNVCNLPFNHWNQNTVILGIPYGSDAFVSSYWNEKYDEFNAEVGYFQSYTYLTFQAKSIISKSKLMPKLSYLSSVLPMPFRIKEKVDKRLLRFLVPHQKTFLTVEHFAAKRHMGGINFANVLLHNDIMLVRNVLQFIKTKELGIPLSEDQYYLEYYIGHQISVLWNVPVDNRTPHAMQPNQLYLYVLNVVKMLKDTGLTKEIILTGSVKQIYDYVMQAKYFYNFSHKWKLLHVKYLPNYLNTFNYKVHFNLLPVKAKFVQYGLDTESRCKFCDIGFETEVHIFAKCNKLRVVWDFFDEVLAVMGINYRIFSKRTLVWEFDVMSISCVSVDFKIVMYLTTIVNYHIWRYRNQCIYENENFDYENLVMKIFRSVCSRKNMEHRIINERLKIPRIEELCSTMLLIKNLTFHIDNG